MFDKFRKIFFENINLKQTIFKNTFWLAAAEITTGLLRLALVIFVARTLGSTEYGKFTFAYSFVSLFAILSDLGISFLVTREFSKEKEKEKEYPVIVSLKIFLSAGVLVLTVLGSLFVSNLENVRSIVWILTIFIFSDGFFNIIYPFIRARQKMEYEAFVKIVQAAITFIAGILVIFYFPSAISLSYVYLSASIIVLSAVAVYFHFFVYPLKLVFDIPAWKKILKNSWALTFGFVGTWVYINVDSVMIGFLGKTSEVGWYNAASKIVLSIILIAAGLVSRSFYPALCKLFKEANAKFQKGWDYYMKLMIFLSVPIMIGGWVFASRIIDLLYGLGNYHPSVFIFQILIILAGITFLHYPYSTALVIFGRQKVNFFVMLTAVFLSVILNFVFIPIYGFNIVPINTVIANIVVLFITIAFFKRYTPINPFDKDIIKILGVALFSGLVMFLLVTSPTIFNLNIFFCIILGAVVYCLSFLGLFLGMRFIFSGKFN